MISVKQKKKCKEYLRAWPSANSVLQAVIELFSCILSRETVLRDNMHKQCGNMQDNKRTKLMCDLSDAPHKNYSKLHCSAALALSHIEYL